MGFIDKRGLKFMFTNRPSLQQNYFFLYQTSDLQRVQLLSVEWENQLHIASIEENFYIRMFFFQRKQQEWNLFCLFWTPIYCLLLSNLQPTGQSELLSWVECDIFIGPFQLQYPHRNGISKRPVHFEHLPTGSSFQIWKQQVNQSLYPSNNHTATVSTFS